MVNPQFPSQMQFLKAVCLEFGLDTKRSKLEQMGELQRFLVDRFKADQNVVLAIDEAQLLVGQQFELIRQFLNFETNTTKLITVVLAGQPELRNKLRLKRALASRIAVNSTLDALTYEDTRELIRFRLMVAGYKSEAFSDETCKAIYDRTLGVPREVVKTCGLALELARINGLTVVPEDLIGMARSQVTVA
jgi:general secretion pathway protein A